MKNRLVDDRISIGLLAVATVSLLAALTATATATPRVVPERYLDRVRGANKEWYRAVNPTFPNCSYVMAFFITVGWGLNAVPWTGCNAGNVGTLCIQCADIKNYQLNQAPGDGPLAFPRPVGQVNCNPPSGGNSGHCMLVGANFLCNVDTGIQCNVTAFNYSLEP